MEVGHGIEKENETASGLDRCAVGVEVDGQREVRESWNQPGRCTQRSRLACIDVNEGARNRTHVLLHEVGEVSLAHEAYAGAVAPVRWRQALLLRHSPHLLLCHVAHRKHDPARHKSRKSYKDAAAMIRGRGTTDNKREAQQLMSKSRWTPQATKASSSELKSALQGMSGPSPPLRSPEKPLGSRCFTRDAFTQHARK